MALVSVYPVWIASWTFSGFSAWARRYGNGPLAVVLVMGGAAIALFWYFEERNKRAAAATARTLAMQQQQLIDAERARQQAASDAARDAERRRQWDARKASERMAEYFRTLHPRRFEHVICLLYVRMGYEAETTSYSGDDGIDGLLRRDGKVYILQCKRVQGSVGAQVLRELYGTVAAERATGGIVVTTGGVSRAARRWLARVRPPIQIVELPELVGLAGVHFSADTIPDDFFVEADGRARSASLFSSA